MAEALTLIDEDLKGKLSVKLANKQTLDDLCVQYIPEYNKDRFEAVAIRIFTGDETVITIYAVDKMRQESSSVHEGKIPVKKFKLTTLLVPDLFSYCSGFNCTLSTGNFHLEDMEVINK